MLLDSAGYDNNVNGSINISDRAIMMSKEAFKRLAVKGSVAYIAIFSLVLLAAMPALALLANSVGTREIQDHSIRSRDLHNESVIFGNHSRNRNYSRL